MLLENQPLFSLDKSLLRIDSRVLLDDLLHGMPIVTLLPIDNVAAPVDVLQVLVLLAHEIRDQSRLFIVFKSCSPVETEADVGFGFLWGKGHDYLVLHNGLWLRLLELLGQRVQIDHLFDACSFEVSII